MERAPANFSAITAQKKLFMAFAMLILLGLMGGMLSFVFLSRMEAQSVEAAKLLADEKIEDAAAILEKGQAVAKQAKLVLVMLLAISVLIGVLFSWLVTRSIIPALSREGEKAASPRPESPLDFPSDERSSMDF